MDVEPDLDFFLLDKNPEERRSLNSWNGVGAAESFARELRSGVVRDCGEPRFAWFVRADPQVESDFGRADFAFREFKDLLSSWRALGDEVGLHVHAWRYDPLRRGWVDDRADQAWVERCVRTGFMAYESHVGAPPRCFRFGNRWINTETMNLVRRLGARVDMTVEPGYQDSPHSMHLTAPTDWTRMPRKPYAPSAEDYAQPAQGESGQGFVELPISTIPRGVSDKLGRIVDVLLSTTKNERTRIDKPHGPLARELLFYLRSRFESLYLADAGGRFRRGVRWLLRATSDTPYVALVVRSDDFLYEGRRRRMLDNIRIIVKEARKFGANVAFVTPVTELSTLLAG